MGMLHIPRAGCPLQVIWGIIVLIAVFVIYLTAIGLAVKHGRYKAVNKPHFLATSSWVKMDH